MAQTPKRKLPPLWIQILLAMVLGVAVGFPLNLLTGPSQKWDPVETDTAMGWVEVKAPWTVRAGRPARLHVVNEGEIPAEFRLREGDEIVVEPLTVDGGSEHVLELDGDETASARTLSVEVRSSVFLSSTQVSLRASTGRLERRSVLRIAGIGKWMGDIFLALLKMIVVPLIFASLVTSIVSLGSQEGFARLGGRTAAYYIATSLLAITLGLIVVNVLRPGDGMDYNDLMVQASGELAEHGKTLPATLQEGGTTWGVLAGIFKRMIPENVIQSASVNRELLAVIFFALVFGFAAMRVGGRHAEVIRDLAKAVEATMTKLTHGILYIAPIGIFGYIVFVTAATGLSLAKSLGLYMLTVFLALLGHAVITLPLILRVVGGRSPVEYVRAMGEALSTAFSTASSAATLPLTMQCATERAHVPERVTSFTLPLGATVNMDGTALYEAVAVLFIAQMLGDLTIAQQIIVVITALLASIGAAGIPHAGTVMMVIVLQAVGLPTDAVLLILAVDRVLDMCRTAVNVWSDSVGAAVIARLEPDPEPVAAEVST